MRSTVISGLGWISPVLAAIFGTDPVGLAGDGGPKTGNQRRIQLAKAIGARFLGSSDGYVATKANRTTYRNPKRNAERKAYRARRAADRLRGTVPYQRGQLRTRPFESRSTHG